MYVLQSLSFQIYFAGVISKDCFVGSFKVTIKEEKNAV